MTTIESTGWVTVDTYALDSGWFDDGDGTWDLVLNGITHTGLVGGSAPVPEVTFGYVQLANRADTHVDSLNLPSLNRARLASIATESGAVVSVTYCFPQFWALVQPPATPD